MRCGFYKLLIGAAAGGRSGKGGRGAWLALAMLLTVGLFGRSVEAQFSGPVLGVSSPVNPPTTITTDPAILFPKNRDVYLWREDLITIHLYDHVDYAPTVRVGLDGMIQLPLIGNLQVEGMTVHEAQALIAEKLVSAAVKLITVSKKGGGARSSSSPPALSCEKSGLPSVIRKLARIPLKRWTKWAEWIGRLRQAAQARPVRAAGASPRPTPEIRRTRYRSVIRIPS